MNIENPHCKVDVAFRVVVYYSDSFTHLIVSDISKWNSKWNLHPQWAYQFSECGSNQNKNNVACQTHPALVK